MLYITLISACKKNSFKRSRRILDRYAIRRSDRTWNTAITEQGLKYLQQQLAKQSTKNTAVACYQQISHHGQNFQLIWVVGSKAPFSHQGRHPVATRRIKRSPPPPWVRAACLLAQAGGLAHDLGKLNNDFVQKLERAINANNPFIKDPVRHEWVSMKLLDAWHQNKSLTTYQAKLDSAYQQSRFKKRQPLDNAHAALAFIVVTHHKLLGPIKIGGTPNSEAHINNKDQHSITFAAPPPEPLLNTLATLIQRLERQADPGDKPLLYWRGLSILARAALIMADHTVSAWRVNGQLHHHPYPLTPPIYANTQPMTENQFGYNQELGWHLHHVSNKAADYAYRINTLRLTPLSTATVEHLLQPMDEDHPFIWQQRAFTAARRIAQAVPQTPCLVFNVAATGTGKTRANVQIACALNPNPRFSIALNLRTLTLQTGDALQQLGLTSHEYATVIGERTVKVLHEWQRDIFDPLAPSNDDNAHKKQKDDEDESEFDVLGAEATLPPWLNPFLAKRPQWRSLIGVPVLVSTIDFLIAAGEPGQQGRHIAALLRLADSDLILDEIDSYDPKAFIAVLRLIQMAALLGRHVICSSATLAFPVVNAVQRAFCNGLAMRSALEQRDLVAIAPVLIVDHQIQPSQCSLNDIDKAYKTHITQLMQTLADKFNTSSSTSYRRAYLQQIATISVESWQNAVIAAVMQLHYDHRWQYYDDQFLSLGLVRIANINTAIPLARYLADHLSKQQVTVRVACYHSQDFLIQRWHKERRLDQLLTRKTAPDGNGTLLADREIQQLVAQAPTKDVILIVVATPVEEIGRDHDFDWAVIEPSSTQSLVQTAGRVNRHRLKPITEPNIAILQYNMRKIMGKQPIFSKPGLESKPYACHDLAQLLNWSQLATENFDARVRFSDQHPLAVADDQSLEQQFEEPLQQLEATTNYLTAWMSEGFYHSYPLRDRQPQERWCLDAEERLYRSRYEKKHGVKTLELDIGTITPSHENAWLVLTPTQMLTLCDEVGLTNEQGMAVDLPHADNTALEWDQAFGWMRHYK
jgi:CRISPR-associated endonuclease/helicase Cas3